MKEEEVKIDCFGYKGYKCLALNDVRVPEECKKCKFRKKEQFVTNGVYYPPSKNIWE